MARSIEQRLSALARDPSAPDVLGALRGTVGMLVAGAVKHAERFGVAEGELLRALVMLDTKVATYPLDH